MKTYQSGDARRHFSEAIEAAQQGPVRIEKRGRPVAALISHAAFEELQELKLLALREEIAKGLADIKAGRTRPADEAFEEIFVRLDRGAG